VERILSYPPLFIKATFIEIESFNFYLRLLYFFSLQLTHKLLQTCAGHSPIDCLRIAHLLNQNKKKILTNFSVTKFNFFLVLNYFYNPIQPPTTLKEVSRELLESLVPADPADYSSVDFLKERVPQSILLAFFYDSFFISLLNLELL
jgi:hypothetical protein